MSGNTTFALGYDVKRRNNIFENLNINSIMVLKNCVPFFLKKYITKNSKITLLEKDKILTNDTKIVKTSNVFLKT